MNEIAAAVVFVSVMAPVSRLICDRDGAGEHGRDLEDFALSQRREEAVAELDDVQVAGVVLGERRDVADVGAAADERFERGRVIRDVR